MNAAMITAKTRQLSDSLGLTDQLKGMTEELALNEMARRFELIHHSRGASMCREMAAMAKKYAA